jgi:hypothetical protein
MKLPLVAIIAAGLLILAAVITIPLISGETKGEDKVNNEVKIPSIDTARPDETETATFALG